MFFFFNDPATTEIYTLSLHDALPIFTAGIRVLASTPVTPMPALVAAAGMGDRKSTRLNSSHGYISYAVFCLKKKKNIYPALYRQSSFIATSSTFMSAAWIH